MCVRCDPQRFSPFIAGRQYSGMRPVARIAGYVLDGGTGCADQMRQVEPELHLKNQPGTDHRCVIGASQLARSTSGNPQRMRYKTSTTFGFSGLVD